MKARVPPEGVARGPFDWKQTADGYVADWPGVLRLRATTAGEITDLVVAPDAPSDAVEKIRNGAAIAFVRAIAGKASLHASAVARDGIAILCVGPSGAGKSSLAKGLCEVGGACLLADDITVVDEIAGRWHASPSERAVWLRSSTDVGETKTPALCPTSASPAPIVWVAHLSFDDDLDRAQVRLLKGAAMAVCVLLAIVGLEPDPTPASLRRDLALVASISAQASVLEVARPRRAPIEATARAILNAADNPCTLSYV
jgi:hypothetical protein